jgi:hypothetical protein
MGIPDPDAPVTERICDLKRADVTGLKADFAEFKEDFKEFRTNDFHNVEKTVSDTKEAVGQMQSSLAIWREEHEKLHNRATTFKTIALNGIGLLIALLSVAILLIKSIK